jgi:DNA-binding transcriptional LysR family regulator
MVARSFQEQLRKRGVDWFPSIEVSSLELIETYVANGLGAGVALALPGKKFSRPRSRTAVERFSADDFGRVVGRRKTPLLETFLKELKLRAQRLA